MSFPDPDNRAFIYNKTSLNIHLYMTKAVSYAALSPVY